MSSGVSFGWWPFFPPRFSSSLPFYDSFRDELQVFRGFCLHGKRFTAFPPPTVWWMNPSVIIVPPEEEHDNFQPWAFWVFKKLKDRPQFLFLSLSIPPQTKKRRTHGLNPLRKVEVNQNSVFLKTLRVDCRRKKKKKPSICWVKVSGVSGVRRVCVCDRPYEIGNWTKGGGKTADSREGRHWRSPLTFLKFAYGCRVVLCAPGFVDYQKLVIFFYIRAMSHSNSHSLMSTTMPSNEPVGLPDPRSHSLSFIR